MWFDVDEARASSAQLSCGQGTLLLTLGATAGLVGIGFLPLFEVDVRPVRRYLILLRIALPWLIRLLMRGAIGLLPRIIERRFTGVCVLGAFVVHDVQRPSRATVPLTMLRRRYRVGVEQVKLHNPVSIAGHGVCRRTVETG